MTPKLTPEELKSTLGPDWKGKIAISWSDEETRIEFLKHLGLDEWERVYTTTEEGFIFVKLRVIGPQRNRLATILRGDIEAIIAGDESESV